MLEPHVDAELAGLGSSRDGLPMPFERDVASVAERGAFRCAGVEGFSAGSWT